MHEGMPTPQDQHRKLATFAGTWVGEETMHPSPWDEKGGTAVGKKVSRIDLDGFYLIEDYTQERDGQVSYRGHGLFGYDPQKNRYTMHWFDSMGMPTNEASLGTWEGNTLRFEMSSPMGQQRYIFITEGTTRYTFKIENSQDGKTWNTFMEGKYTKK